MKAWSSENGEVAIPCPFDSRDLMFGKSVTDSSVEFEGINSGGVCVRIVVKPDYRRRGGNRSMM
jgi:hypothetical protein